MTVEKLWNVWNFSRTAPCLIHFKGTGSYKHQNVLDSWLAIELQKLHPNWLNSWNWMFQLKLKKFSLSNESWSNRSKSVLVNSGSKFSNEITNSPGDIVEKSTNGWNLLMDAIRFKHRKFIPVWGTSNACLKWKIAAVNRKDSDKMLCLSISLDEMISPGDIIIKSRLGSQKIRLFHFNDSIQDFSKFCGTFLWF